MMIVFCMPTSLPRSQESNRYYNMVTTLVFPAIVEKFKHMRVREVTMQQDSARCHTCKKKDGFEAMTQKLNAAGAKLRPRIKVVTQPAQSPDVNIAVIWLSFVHWPAPCGNVAVSCGFGCVAHSTL